MSWINFFKPAPYLPEITNQQEVKKKYHYWRIRTFYSMYVGYALYYFTRKSFAFAMPALSSALGFTKVQLGMLGTILALSYGASKFVSGVISDKSNPRYFMSIGLILTGIFNIFFGLSSSLIMLAIFWGLNGWFQGWGWPPCAKMLTHWYSQKERGSWWSMWNTSHNLGGFLIPLIVSYIAEASNWRFAMILPGAFTILGGLFLLNRLRDVPKSLGLPTIEKFKDDYPTKDHHVKDRLELSAKEILINYTLKNKYIWLLAFAYFFVYIMRFAINDWTLYFLIEQKGYSYKVAGFGVSWFEIGGAVGSLAAGWGSDWLFKGKRGPVNLLFTLFTVIVIVMLWKIPCGVFLDILFIFLIGFFVFGPQMLIGVAAAELSHKKAAGTATGFVGWFAYFGTAVTGGPLGIVIDKFGWSAYYFVLTLCGIVAFLLLLPLWGVKNNPNIYDKKKLSRTKV